jgi:hypothetical protein
MLTALCCSLFFTAGAQPQNQQFRRFQYHSYRWRAFHTPAFHVYFPDGYDSLCAFVARELPSAAKVIAARMGTASSQVPNVIVYPSLDQLYESNIGSSGPHEVTFPTFVTKGNRLLLAYTGSYEDLRAQLYEALARSAWETALSGGAEAQIGQANREAIPYWMSEGAIRYFAHGWPIAAEDRLLNIVQAEQPTDTYELMARYPALYGQAFCYYLSKQFMRQTPVQVFFQLKKGKPLVRVLRLVTQTPADSLYAGCLRFFTQRAVQLYSASDRDSTNNIYPVNFAHRRGRIVRVLSDPSGNFIATVSAVGHNRYTEVYDTRSHNRFLVERYSLPPWISDHNADLYPLLAWNGQSLLVARPEKGVIKIKRYSTTGQWQATYPLEGADGISALSLTNGTEWLLAAWRRAQSDIVTYDGQRNSYHTITNDDGDDHSPSLLSNSMFLFTSERKQPRKRTHERLADTVIATHGIFKAQNQQVLPWLTDTAGYIRYGDPLPLTDGRVLLTTTRNGTRQYALASNSSVSKDALHLLDARGSLQYLPGSNEVATYRATQ